MQQPSENPEQPGQSPQEQPEQQPQGQLQQLSSYPPLPHQRFGQWIRRHPILAILSGIFLLLCSVCSLCTMAVADLGSHTHPVAQATQTPSPTATLQPTWIPTAIPTQKPTSVPSPTPKPSPSHQSTHYPPMTAADLHALAAKGDASAIHEFHSEGVGLATCPQPRREVTVDPSVTGQQLAEDLLAYFYAQQIDNPCGTLVLAYHNQGEAGDAYTAGRINVDVTDSSGATNLDPNASNLKHKLSLDIGSVDTNQEFVITY